jgi:hypothetical protein
MESKGKEQSVLINPAGGLYYNDSPGVRQWVYQKPVFNGIYIDSLTIDIAIPLADILKTIGLNVYTTRLVNKVYKGYNNKWQNAMGESQQPRYRECCIQYLKSIVTYENDKEKKYLPAEIYNEGTTHLEKDTNARINYAKFINASMMITLDVATYVTDGGIEAICNKAVGSETLANYMIDEVAKRTRAVVKGVSYIQEPEDMKYNSLVCPAVILRCGSTADVRSAGLLTQGWYRQWISLGIFAGIWKYINQG